MTIDIGALSVLDGTNNSTGNYTWFLGYNPANATGQLTQAEIWWSTVGGGTDAKIGVTYQDHDEYFIFRDWVNIGDVTSGSKQTYLGLSIDTVIGDYIGCYCTIGIRYSTATPSDWYGQYPGDLIDGLSHAFGGAESLYIALGGTGTETAVGIPQPIWWIF
jgi:hypothetical protein